MRRNQTQFQVSLFSFQDIIISVSGILILMVLLLALELTESTEEHVAQQALAQMAEDLEKERTQIAKSIVQLEEELDDDSAMIQLATKNPQGEVKKRLAQKQTQVEDLEDSVDDLEQIATQLKQTYSDETRVLAEANADSERQLNRLTKEIEELKDEIESLKSGQGAQYVSPQGVEPEKAWLCDVGAHGLKLLTLDDSGRTHTIPSSDMKSETELSRVFRELKRWRQTTTPVVRYVLFVIRPSGLEFSEKVNFDVADTGLQFGIELVDEGHSILNK